MIGRKESEETGLGPGFGSIDAIRLTLKGSSEAAATRWSLILILFMRLLAVVWLLQGLVQWHAILLPTRPGLLSGPESLIAWAVGFFAVVNVIAGVGLWLATPWGGVIWLFAVAAQLFASVAIPNFMSYHWGVIGLDFILVVLYFILTFQAGREKQS